MMAYTEKCPLCASSGQLVVGQTSSEAIFATCHGCDGKGWVSIPDLDEIGDASRTSRRAALEEAAEAVRTVMRPLQHNQKEAELACYWSAVAHLQDHLAPLDEALAAILALIDKPTERTEP